MAEVLGAIASVVCVADVVVKVAETIYRWDATWAIRNSQLVAQATRVRDSLKVAQNFVWATQHCPALMKIRFARAALAGVCEAYQTYLNGIKPHLKLALENKSRWSKEDVVLCADNLRAYADSIEHAAESLVAAAVEQLEHAPRDKLGDQRDPRIEEENKKLRADGPTEGLTDIELAKRVKTKADAVRSDWEELLSTIT